MNSLVLMAKGSGIWGRSAMLYAARLSSKLGDDLVMVAALDREEPLVYESNVLVVVRERSEEVVSEVLRAKREVERELGERVTISPLITTPDDPIIEAFLRTSGDSEEEAWREAVDSLKSRLSSKLGDDLVMVAALDREEPLVYESNVLVVVRERSEEVVSEVLRAKREVERELGERVTISPLITTPDDPIIEAFLEEAEIVEGIEPGRLQGTRDEVRNAEHGKGP